MHAESNKSRTLPAILTVLLLTSTALGAPPASAGSALVEGPSEFQEGMTIEAAATEEGLRLARDESLIGNWTRMDGWPTPRYYHGMAFDGASGVSVLFGGLDGTCSLNDTWTLDLQTSMWARTSPARSPPARQSPAMAFDGQNGLVVLFGGDDGSSPLDDTWTYDTSTATWTNMDPATPPAAQPSESYEMACSESDGVMVLFGGGNQTWTYNVSTNAWNREYPDPAPPVRQYHSLAYDRASGAVVLFGGFAGGVALNDTWTYDVARNLWTNITPAVSPPARYGHGMAYDAVAGRMVIFSGYDEYGLILNDTWTLDTGTPAWTEMRPVASPYPRCYYGIAFDALAGETVLFGGASSGSRNGDTWTYNASANTWSRRTPAPRERTHPSMAYVDSARAAVLFGGNDPSTHFCDTWTYDHRFNIWTDMRPASAPPARAGGALVYDARDDRCILFGGRWGPAAWQTLDDTWAYDAGTNTWTEMSPSQAPTSRAFHAMACDPESGLSVLYGGWGEFGITNDTWVYNLSADTWTRKYPDTSPPARQEAAMAHDAESGLFVLFGGVAGNDLKDTWTYNLSSNVWTKMNPGRSPTARLAQMVGAGGELLLVGGCTSDLTKVYNETWAYDVNGNEWSERNPVPGIPGRARMGLAGDAGCGVVVLFGGWYDGHHGDTWAYSLNRHSPAGGFVSRPVDLGGPAAFGRIEWTAEVPETTLLAFQLRSSDTEEDLEWAEYLGPDGTADTYYSRSGEQLGSGHNGSRWIQYRAGFTTAVAGQSPLLGEVRIIYNLPPEVSITAPVGNENWSGVQNITWEATEPDGDAMSFDLVLVNASDLGWRPLALNLTNTTSYEWDTTSVQNGEYFIHLIGRDDDPEIPQSGNYTSPLFSISNKHPNRPPAVSLSSPSDNETLYTTRVTLEWSGSDPDGDPLSYYVFLAESPLDPENPPAPLVLTAKTSYSKYDLRKGATYYWTVLANDGKVNGTMAELRTFSVVANRPPSVELLSPVDGATIDTPAVALSWNGSDPDSDVLAFRVYLATHDIPGSNLPPPYATTRDTSCAALDLRNGTVYYWTVAAFDGEVAGAFAPVRSFKVSLSASENPPRVIGHAPNGAGVAVRPTVLLTFDREMDNESVFTALSFSPPIDVTGFVRLNTTFQFSLGAEFAHNTTYEVTVHTAAMSLGGQYLAEPFVWNFTTIAAGERDSDRPVVVMTEPADGARRVDPRANITIVFSEAMNFTATPRAVSFDPFVNARYKWVMDKGFALRYQPLGPMPDGIVRVTVTMDALDESGNPLLANYTFGFRVGLIVPRLTAWGPQGKGLAQNSTIWLAFDRPMNQSSLMSAVTVRPAVTVNWTHDGTMTNFTLEPVGGLRAGTRYTVSVAPGALDLEDYELQNGTTWTFTTVAGPVEETEIPWLWLLFAVVIAAAAAGGALYAKRRRRAPAGEVTGGPAAGEPGESADGGEAGAEAAGGEAAAGAAAAGAVPRAPAAKGLALPAAPEPFAVEDVFLLYRDGRLMMHIGQSAGEPSFPGLLSAVQGLLPKVPEKREEDAPPVKLRHAGRNVLFERGRWTAMAAVTTGPDPESFREEMLAQVRNVEAEVGAILPEWDGRHELLGPAKRFVNSMAVFTAPQQDALEIASTDKVTLKGEVDFHQGYIRLRVGIRNCLVAPVTGAELKLVYNRDALRLELVEPALRRKGDALLLGDLAPDDKKQVAFLLDPQICTESYLEGILTFKDPSGKLETAKMPRKLTSVVCPILATDENINTAMLKKMSDTELAQRATKVFMIPSGLTPPGAFEVAKSAVQHHDVKLVREFDEAQPFIGEAWYFGKLKGRDDRLVVRARVIGARNMLEFYVASSSTLLLNGMLAELKNDLKKEMDAIRGRAQAPVKQVTDQNTVDALATFQSLLDKATELEKQDKGS